METFDVAISEGGRGFLGASIASEATIMEPNFKKAQAMDTAVIQETKDAWLTRSEAYRNTGEINSLLRIDSGNIIALNTRIDMKTLQESAHFIKWDGRTWKEISYLPIRVIRVWAEAGPFVFTAGYPEDGFEPVFLFASFDGAATWEAITLAGVNPLDTGHNEQAWLDGDGRLYAINGRHLQAFSLPKWRENPTWKTVQTLPENFMPIRLSGNTNGIYTVGRLADKSLAIWSVPKSGSPSLVRANGLPDTLQPERLWVRDHLLRMTATQEMTKNGETTGYRNWLFESKDDGATWRDMDLPIHGSLGAISFGDDGRIWVMAAGNRMQVYQP